MIEISILAERVEALDGPCEKTDCDIACATGWTLHIWRDHKHIEHNFWTKGGESLSYPPAFTASIDAAMTIIPDGWGFKLESYVGRPSECVVGILDSDGFYVFDYWAKGKKMSNNMIERVARVLCKENRGQDIYWETWIGDAVLCIKAMREPTPAMIKAGFESISASCDINPAELRIAWQVMIDSILSENNPK